MLTLYTKERLSRPSLSVVESQEYKELNLPVLEVLKTLKPGELLLEDDDSGSDITDPFEDLKENLGKGLQKAKKKLSRLEKSLQLMESFSDDFKKAMEETREELKLDSQLYYEDIEEITETLKQSVISKNLSKSMQAKLNEILENDGIPPSSPDLDIPDPQPGEDPPDSESETEDDVMSGVWNMLATSRGLIATPPFYNAHRQQAPHWLDRDGMRWEKMDEAKEKCVKWMRKLEDSGDEQEIKNK